MTNQIMSNGMTGYRRKWLYKFGGVSALVAGTLLLVGLISLVASVLQPGITGGELPLFGNNWLAKIFVLHAGLSGIHAELQGVNLLDVVILLLVSDICLGISTLFYKARRVWSLMAFALSLIAIVLFLATQIAGRSTVMLAVLIISFVMLGDRTFGRFTVYSGIAASIFLFVGDLTVGIHANLITILFGVGYVLLVIWFYLIGQRLYRLSLDV